MAASISTDTQAAAHILQGDGLVAIPTETVYGLAGNALKPEVVAKIFAVKARPSFDPLILHTSDIDRLMSFVEVVPAPLKLLAEQFWPGPLTLVLPKRPVVPDIVTAGLPTVAVRVPQHLMTRDLLARLDFPLAAPSANPFGYVSPTTAQHVVDQLGDDLEMVLDGGPCTVGLESTIITMQEDRVVVLRKGGLTIEAIEEVIGPVLVAEHSTSNPQAPGMLASHYATSTTIVLDPLEDVLKDYLPSQLGLLAFSQVDPRLPSDQQMVLSQTGDLAEAASRLFAAMRALDSKGLDCIVAERVPNYGLGTAINDKLQRAAVQV